MLNDAYATGFLPVYSEVKRVAINDTFYSVAGNQQCLRELAGVMLNKGK